MLIAVRPASLTVPGAGAESFMQAMCLIGAPKPTVRKGNKRARHTGCAAPIFRQL
jgi:hypothetical protein